MRRIANEHEPLTEVALGITVAADVPLSCVWVVLREREIFLETANRMVCYYVSVLFL